MTTANPSAANALWGRASEWLRYRPATPSLGTRPEDASARG